jgi:hypothetical protein
MARFDQFTQEVVKGDTLRFRVTMTDSITGLPIDITSHATFHFTAKEFLTDADASAFLALVEPTNITRTAPLVGQLEVTILPANTLAKANRRWALYAEVYAKNSAGEIDRTQGTLIVKPSVRGAN